MKKKRVKKQASLPTPEPGIAVRAPAGIIITNNAITAGASFETAIAVQKLADAVTAAANALSKASSSTGISIVDRTS